MVVYNKVCAVVLLLSSCGHSQLMPHGLEAVAAMTASRGAPVDGLAPLCLSHMQLYWRGLDQEQMWASQIYDATGRYSSGYLFGNDFWLGSSMLCNEVKSPEFNVSFRVAKLALTLSENITSQARIVYVGLCQPATCSTNDSSLMISTWTSQHAGLNQSNDKFAINVLSVRSVPGQNSVTSAPAFYVISIILIAAFILVATASIYDNLTTNQEKTENNNDVGVKNDAYVNDGKETEKAEERDLSTSSGTPAAEQETTEEKCNKRKECTRGKAAQFLLAFSAIRNGKQIFSLKSQGNGSLACIHGLRFFSLMWVILVHTYLQFFAIGGNKMVRQVTERSFMFRTIGNATFSVDTFLFISGALGTYLYTAVTKNLANNIIEFFNSLAYRLIRLTPVYMLVLAMVQLSMTYIHNNSVFEPTIFDHYNCGQYWWRNVLYINNFFPRSQMCMLWSWYLAVDTQFFALTSIILIISKRRPKLAAGLLGMILMAAWTTTALVAYLNSYTAKISEPFRLFDELYDKPWTRIGPYITGMAAGYFIKNHAKQIPMNRVVQMMGWSVSVGILVSVVYGLGSGLSVPMSAVYVSLSHTAWGLALAWILVSCYTGHGGVMNRVLANPALYPLSRLTFCAYLVHPLIMVLTSYVMDTSFHIHNGIIVILFLGNAVASFLLSFILSIGFESPIVNLLKIYFR